MLLKVQILFINLLRRPAFILLIKDGNIQQIKGKVNTSFINDCRDIAKINKRQTGLIYAKQRSGGRVKVSGKIDAGTQQRIRNVWSFNR